MGKRERLQRTNILLNPEPRLLPHLLPERVLELIERAGGFVLYDLDGVLYSDSAKHWVKSLNTAWGTKFKLEDYTRYHFKSFKRPKGKSPAEKVLAPAFHDPSNYLKMKVLEGMAKVTLEVQKRGVPQGIATSRPAEVREATVKMLHQDGAHFDFLLFSWDKVPLAKALGGCCLAFEDNPHMIMSFYREGVPCYAFADPRSVPYIEELDHMYTEFRLGRKFRNGEEILPYPWRVYTAEEVGRVIESVFYSRMNKRKGPLRR